MAVQNVLLILLTGVLAGFINTVAGGGSLLAMPVLIFMGLPSAVANGTNRIALMVQNLVAISNFRRKGFFDYKFGIMLAVPAIIGSIIGARLAVNLPDRDFNNILAVVMIAVLILILIQPQKRYLKEKEQLTKGRKAAAVIAFFFVGIYGGFIQGGVGFIIIGALSLITGMSLIKINSVKVMVVGMYILSSLLVFIINGKVNWLLGFVLAVGNAFGGWLGSSFAVTRGDKWIRVVLTIAMAAMALKLLGIIRI